MNMLNVTQLLIDLFRVRATTTTTRALNLKKYEQKMLFFLSFAIADGHAFLIFTRRFLFSIRLYRGVCEIWTIWSSMC